MKRIFSLIAVLLLLICLGSPVYAYDYGMPVTGAVISDGAGLLTDGEEGLLVARASELWRQYRLNIAIVTTDTLHGKSPRQYAEDAYDGLYGEGTDGILFLLSMEDRDWYISTSGRAMDLLTDGEADDSADEALAYLGRDEFYEGMDTWLEGLPHYLDSTEPEPQPSILIALVIGLAVALIAVLLMRRAMNTKRQQHSARDYLIPGSYRLGTCQDFYLYSRTTRTARPKSSSSSSGGRSHGGGGGKF